MLTILTELLIGGTLILLGICWALTVGQHMNKIIAEIKWLNKGISELVVPRKQK